MNKTENMITYDQTCPITKHYKEIYLHNS